jgi:phosphate transport system substrate-binding protein
MTNTLKTSALKKVTLISAAIAVTATVSTTAMARDYIEIVGSSTVYPFATVVAENFSKTTDFKAPKVESTGSGGGFKMFCNGVGAGTPDITNASRAIKASEIELCASNGVKDIIEINVGYDGIAFANAKASPQLTISREDLYLALASQVPVAGEEGKLIENPYKTWKDVNPTLPAIDISVYGPPPTSGTRDAFVELVMEGGCKQTPWIKALKKTDKSKYKAICHAIREDGGFIEAGENDNLIVQKLNANPNSYGIFGYSFLEQNGDKVQGSKVDGVEPTFDSIADGSYPVSRPLFFYVKKAHVGVIPGIAEFLNEFTAKKTMGEDGVLSDKGLIPLPSDEYKAIRSAAVNLTPNI